MSEQHRQEAGQREQGTRTEHPSDLSSPQMTDPVEESEVPEDAYPPPLEDREADREEAGDAESP